MILLKQMIVLFILMLLGFYLAKIHILDPAVNSKISWLVVNVANPAMIISASLDESDIQPQKLLEITGISIVIYLFLLILGRIIPIVFRIPVKQRSVYCVMTVFGNIGFMGFPIMSAMYGSESLLYGSIFLLPFNLLIYTYGINAMTGNTNKANNKERTDEEAGEKNNGSMKGVLRKVVNPGIIACIITVLIFVLQLPVPYVISKTVTMLSNLTAPLSMMVIGASMVGISFRELAGDGKLLLYSLFRQIVLPLIFFVILRQFIEDPLMLGVCMIVISAPAASMVTMLAQQYQGDTQTASKGVILTTLLSVVTMPLVFALTGM